MNPADAAILQAVVLASVLAWASGIRLYFVLFIVGLAGRYGYIDLPASLGILTHTYVLVAAGVLLAVEFLADKVPGLDSAWDAVHTFIRIPAGALLAAGAIGGEDLTALTIAAGLIGGTITAGTHFTKAGSRAVINTSPEPFSNWVASFSEDALVLGGAWFALQYPVAFLVALAIFLALAAWFLVSFARFVRARFARRDAATSG